MNLYRARTMAIVLIAVLLLALNPMVFAGQVQPSGELTPYGSISVNGAPISTSVTVMSNSRITTGSGSAVANLGSAGQLFIAENTDIMLTFENSMVRVMLYDGEVRVQSPNASLTTVITNNCSKVEVINGTVMINPNDDGSARDILRTNETKEFRVAKKGISSNSMEPVDYRVSKIDCDVAAIPRAKPPNTKVYLALFGGAVGAIVGGLAGGGSSGGGSNPGGGGTGDPTPTSPNTP